ncbi:MAG: DUF1490 domain-containing protein [Coriobacteriales bacterium]|nr:DUF1490 domain-containing protein [Coriobacteriales bacterium]
MAVHHFWLFAGGAAAAGAVAGLATSGILHKGAVAVTSGAMRVADAVGSETQSIVDDANDSVAEARRQAKIDAAVKERLAQAEQKIREEVTQKVDEEGVQA